MSKSKIAIVIAPSLSTWDKATLVREVIDAITDAEGMALVIPSRRDSFGIEDVINLVDGVVLVCPEDCQGGINPVAIGDEYAREFARRAIKIGFNSVRIIGDRNFIASEKEWQDWADFQTCRVETISLSEVETIREELKAMVDGAAMVSAARRLAHGGSWRTAHEIKSPVTHS